MTTHPSTHQVNTPAEGDLWLINRMIRWLQIHNTHNDDGYIIPWIQSTTNAYNSEVMHDGRILMDKGKRDETVAKALGLFQKYDFAYQLRIPTVEIKQSYNFSPQWEFLSW